jgi:hypothetical protein
MQREELEAEYGREQEEHRLENEGDEDMDDDETY